MGQFRRSGTFGIVGVIVTMILVAIVGLQTDPRDASPKETYALVFGIVGVYVVLLFLFQTLDLRRAARADAAIEADAAEIENPATLDEPHLFAAMAVKPIDADAVKARREIWGTTRSSIRLAMLITGLIFLSVPPLYLLDTFVPLLVGGSLIGLIALFKSASLLRSGGDFDKAFNIAGRAMRPLGLEMVERPTLHIEAKGAAPFRLGPAVRGAMILEGERHGRQVSVRVPYGGARAASEVELFVPAPEFEFKARDGRLKAGKGAPEAVAAALKAIPNSPRWNGVKGGGDGDGIAVNRKGSASGDMLLDLWLAERLADAVRR